MTATGAGGGAPVDAGTPIGGGPGLVFINDTFDHGGWWFITTDLGNGYVANRAEARSPTRAGDEYSMDNPAGEWESLNKQFLVNSFTTVDCGVGLYIYPLTAVSGEIDIDDSVTKIRLRAQPFSLSATHSWTFVSTGGAKLASPAGNPIIVRVRLLGTGAWQEMLLDDLNGSCD